MALSLPPFLAFFVSSAVCRFSVGRSGSSAGVAPPLVEAVEVDALPDVLSDDRRFIVGRSGSSAGVALPPVEGAVVVDPSLLLVVLSERRFIVGRSGSSAGAVPPVVLLPVEGAVEVVEPSPLVDVLSERRFIVGRSGSSDEVLPAPVVEVVDPVDPADPFDPLLAVPAVEVLPEDAGVLPASLVESPEERRFIVGRSESSDEAVDVEPVVVLLWSLPPPAVLPSRCGRLASEDEPDEVVRTGSVFEGLSFAGLLATASGLTLP
jgi:hypothetical protein